MDNLTLDELVSKHANKRLLIASMRSQNNGHFGAYSPTEQQIFDSNARYASNISKIDTLLKECSLLKAEIAKRTM